METRKKDTGRGKDGCGRFQEVVVGKKRCRGTPKAVGRKDDNDKSRMDLFPPLAALEVGRVLAHGAKKYGDDNWLDVPNLRRRYLGAALRHLMSASVEVESVDDDSGLPHVAHAACSIMFVLEDILREKSYEKISY